MSIADMLDDPLGFAPPYLDLTLAGWTAFSDNLKLHEQTAEQREKAPGQVRRRATTGAHQMRAEGGVRPPLAPLLADSSGPANRALFPALLLVRNMFAILRGTVC
eukprot:994182-Prorocentrum_minimum.AAC.1